MPRDETATPAGPLPRPGPASDDTEPTGPAYTMAEAAALKGVSYHTVSRAVRAQKLPARRLGRMALIDAADLRTWEPMRERAPRRYRRRKPNLGVQPGATDLAGKSQVSLALELATFHELVQSAAHELPITEFMALVADRFAALLELERVVAWAVEPDRQHARRLAAFGPPFSSAPDVMPLTSLSVVRDALDRSTATMQHFTDFNVPDWAGEAHSVDAFLLAPLRVGEVIQGALIGDRNGAPFALSDEQLALAQAMANQAALALERTRLLGAAAARAKELAAIIENVGEAVFACDAAGELTAVNAAGRALLELDSLPAGADVAAVITNVQRVTFAGMPIPLAEVPLLRAARGETVRDQRHLVIGSAGKTTAVSVTAQPIRGEHGAIEGAVAIVRDITHDFQAAQRDADRMTQLSAAAARSEAVAGLALAVNSSPDLTEALPAALERMTVSLGGAGAILYLRQDDRTLVPEIVCRPAVAGPVAALPAALSPLATCSARFLTADSSLPEERALLAATGAPCLLLLPLRSGREVLGAIGVRYVALPPHAAELMPLAIALAGQCAVVIDRTRLTADLQAAHNRLLAVVDHLPLGIVIVEAPTGALVLANRTAADLLGRPVPVALRDVPELDGGAPAEAADDRPLTRVLRSGEQRLGVTHLLHRPDGTSVTVRVDYVPVIDAGDQVIGAVIVLQDVAQLQALDRAKDEFLSIIGHELRNPLTTLHGNLQLLQRRLQAEDPTATALPRLETIVEQSNRLRVLINRLLDVSRAELGRLDLALAPSDAAAVVQRAAASVQGLSPAHRIVANTPAALPVVWDEVRIEQVLANLLSNAIRHTGGGVITLTASQDAARDEITITVDDTGPGIPLHLIDSLFDRYIRGGSRRPGDAATGAGGLGLGLYISRLIAAAHGGELTAVNLPAGGARFTLRVPRGSNPAPRSRDTAVS